MICSVLLYRLSCEHSIRHTNTNTCSCSSLLGLVVRRLTDAVQLLCAAFLTSFTLHTDVVVHLLGLLLRDAHTVSVIPVGAQVAANVKPSERKRIQKVLSLCLTAGDTD